VAKELWWAKELMEEANEWWEQAVKDAGGEDALDYNPPYYLVHFSFGEDPYDPKDWEVNFTTLYYPDYGPYPSIEENWTYALVPMPVEDSASILEAMDEAVTIALQKKAG